MERDLLSEHVSWESNTRLYGLVSGCWSTNTCFPSCLVRSGLIFFGGGLSRIALSLAGCRKTL